MRANPNGTSDERNAAVRKLAWAELIAYQHEHGMASGEIVRAIDQWATEKIEMTA